MTLKLLLIMEKYALKPSDINNYFSTLFESKLQLPKKRIGTYEAIYEELRLYLMANDKLQVLQKSLNYTIHESEAIILDHYDNDTPLEILDVEEMARLLSMISKTSHLVVT